MSVGGEPFSTEGDYVPDVTPVDVRVVEDVTKTVTEAADYGAYSTRQDIPDVTTGVPIQILQEHPNRKRAFLKLTFLTGGTNPSLQIDRTPSSIQRGFGFGYSMFAGDTIEIKNSRPLYAITTGAPTAVGVSVLEETYENNGGNVSS